MTASVRAYKVLPRPRRQRPYHEVFLRRKGHGDKVSRRKRKILRTISICKNMDMQGLRIHFTVVVQSLSSNFTSGRVCGGAPSCPAFLD
eukprot:31557-Pelagococcus_subviridis.AAC.6